MPHSCTVSSGSSVNAEDLFGCWALREFVVERPSGRRIHPFGEDAQGTLLYSADGWVSAVLSRRERSLPSNATLENAPKLRDEDKVSAFDSYMSYTGRYEISGTTVIHEIVQSLTPGLKGTRLEREAALSDSELTLSYDVSGKSGISTYRLRWVRP